MATARSKAGEPMILELLGRLGRLEADRMALAREAIAGDESSPERALIRAGLVTEREVVEAYGLSTGLRTLDAIPEPVAGSLSELELLLPEKLCNDNLIAPIAVRGLALDLAFVSPERFYLADQVRFLTGRHVCPVIAPLSAVERQIGAIYNSQSKEEVTVEFLDTSHDDDHDEEELALDLDRPPPPDENGRIIRMVNQIFDQALRTGASDIHLEQFEDACKFRLRIDGVLQELPNPSKQAFIKIISRLKILAKMDIAEKRVPQDGAIALKTGEKRIDLRVNTVPTVYGEKIVMRILDKEAIPLDLMKLGLDDRQSRDLIESIHSPHGLAIITGPTGSGKSTTLYSCLNLINEPKVNICTVEDPVEYKFKGMNQVQVKPMIGLTFSTALRAFLRQDPDVIMVGEVRDQETAQICLRAALTGHFVLSTLHTNDALSAVTRLCDMGIEPFLLSCTLRVLEAQRLVRRLCAHCKEGYTVEPETAARYNLTPGETLYRPVGCHKCRKLGYRGRVGIFEVIRITPKLARKIQARATLQELRQTTREEGMKLLFDSALDKVREGLTSMEAALSVTMSDED